jgi:YD repeat-containing protein
MKTKRLIISLLFILVLNIVYSQGTNQAEKEFFLSTQLQPSPTMSALGKFGEIPVSLNTGTPNISIPIYTLTSGDLSVDISLSYDAGGIRVWENAGWTGLKWSLNTGGQISRTVRGYPDDYSGVQSYFMTGNSIPENLDELELNYSDENMNILNNGHPEYNFYKQFGESDKNAEPDIFSYSIGNHSGQFVIDASKEVHTIPYEPLNIAPYFDSYGKLISFTIIDETGTKYVFNDQEISRTTTNPVPILIKDEYDYISTWHLSEIWSAVSTDFIKFKYYDVATEFVNEPSSSVIMTRKIATNLYPQTPPPPNYQTSVTHISEKVLSGVYSSQGCLIFTSSGNRWDLPYSKKLDKIELFSFSSDAAITPSIIDGLVVGNSWWNDHSKYLKTYQFTYNYFNNSSGTYNSTLINYYRLMLTGIKEMKNSAVNNQYKFSYLNPNSLPPQLYDPLHTNFPIDHWGFYNGISNTTLIPTTEYYPNGANRECNIDLVGNGMLSRIEYPTGGYTDFTWESNRAVVSYVLSSVTESANVTKIPTAWSKGLTQYNNLDALLIGHPASSLPANTIADQQADNLGYATFTPTGNVTGTLEYNFNFKPWASAECGTSVPACAVFYIRNLTNPSQLNTEIKYSCGSDCGNTAMKTMSVDLIKGNKYIIYSQLFTFDPVRVYLYNNNTEINPDYYPFIRCRFIDTEATEHKNEVIQNNYPCAGVRIAKIKSYDGSKFTTKRYEYTKFNDRTKSSGILTTYPHYYYHKYIYLPFGDDSYEVKDPPMIPPPLQEQLCFSSNSYNETGKVIYSNVTEYYDEESINKTTSGENISNIGKTEYDYIAMRDECFGNGGFPWAPLKNMSAWNKLWEQRTYRYDNTNNNYVLQKKDIYSYDFVTFSKVKGMKVGDFITNVEYNLEPSEYQYAYCIQLYYYFSDWHYLKQNQETVYDINGFNPVITTKDYYYNNPKSCNISLIIQTQSLNDQTAIVTEFKYPDDFKFTECEDAYYTCQEDDINAHTVAQNAFENCILGGQEECISVANDEVQKSLNKWNEYSNAIDNICTKEKQFLWWSWTEVNLNCVWKKTPIAEAAMAAENAARHLYQECAGALNTTCTDAFDEAYNPADYPCESDYETCFNTHYNNSSTDVKTLIDMQDKHMLNYPVETVEYVTNDGTNVTARSAVFTKYAHQGDYILPKYLYKINTSGATGTTDFTPSYVDASNNLVIDNDYYLDATIDNYSENKVLQYHNSDNIFISFKYWPNNNQPVAKAVYSVYNNIYYNSFEDIGPTNLTLTDANGLNIAKSGSRVYYSGTLALPSSYVGNYMSYWYYKNNQWSFSGIIPFTTPINSGGSYLDEVRVFPGDAQMTTYTYEPMLGISSQTDENNITTYYYYDEFGRLKDIKDNNGNIIKHYEYNYQH